MLYLDNKFTGTKNLIGTDGTDDNWSWAKPNEPEWCISDTYVSSDIVPLMRIYKQETPPIIPDQYLRMLSQLGDLTNANSLKLLGPKYTRLIKERLINDAKWLAKRKDDTYLEFYKITNRWLSTLKPAKLNLPRYNSIVSMGIDLKAKLTRDPDTGTVYVKPPVYARDRSKTGRLSVIDGVRTLTMKAEHRNILSDCYQIDFQAMEPRFLLSLLGKEVEGDFYEWVKNECDFKIMTRDQVKISVLSSMYGHRKQIAEITNLLSLPMFEKELEKDTNNGYLRNWFGRPLDTRGITGRHLVALWLQSTCADAALLGFKNFCESNPTIVPHWSIHDALIFSNLNDSIPLESSIIINWNGTQIKMPYKIGRIE